MGYFLNCLEALLSAYGMAEREGFEPSVRYTPYTRFPGVHLKPLGHLSDQFIQRCFKLPCLSEGAQDSRAAQVCQTRGLAFGADPSRLNGLLELIENLRILVPA